MKVEFEIDDKKFEIGTIKIKDYYQIKTDLLLQGKESEFSIISALSGCPVDLLKKMPLDVWEDMSLGLELLLKGAFHQQKEMIRSFVHEGIEYGLMDMNKITIGEFSDLDVIVSSGNMDQRLHEILAILYRPVVNKKWGKLLIEDYDTDGFKHRSELFLNVDLNIAHSVLGFFLHFAQASLRAMRISSNLSPEMKEQMEKGEQILQALQGNGTTLSYSWQEKIHLESMKLQNLASSKLSTFLLIKNSKLKNLKKLIKKWLKKYKLMK